MEGNTDPRNGQHSFQPNNNPYRHSSPGYADFYHGQNGNTISQPNLVYSQDSSSSSPLFPKLGAKTETLPPYTTVDPSSDVGVKYDQAAGSNYTWTVEAGAIALCLTAVITTLVLLAYADGLPLEKYNFPITFNAVISMLGAVARVNLGFALGSCLGQGKWNFFKREPGSIVAFEKFEDASRGPWGCFWLAVWLKLKHWFVIGAVITILLLGFEPFLQSVIYYKGAMEPIANSIPPSLHRSTHLDAGKFYTTRSGGTFSSSLPNNVSVRYTTFRSQPDLGMLAALYNGFYNGTASADTTTSFLCPSGNCTWDPFASIAACSACHDLTGQLDREEKTGSNLGTLSDSKMVFLDTFLKYSLPYVSLSNAISTREFAAYMSAVPQTLAKNTVSFKDLKTMITSVGVIKADPSYEEEGALWNETAVTATECALYLCTNAYESEVKNGVLNERIIASWADRNLDSYTPLDNRIATEEQMAAYEKHYDHPFYVREKNLERSDLELRIPLEQAKKHNLPLAENTDDSGTATDKSDDYLRFTVTQNTIGSMLEYIENRFFQWNPVESKKKDSDSSSPPNSRGGDKEEDEDEEDEEEEDEEEEEEDEEPAALVWPNEGPSKMSGPSQPPVVQALYDSQDLKATFQSAARSLTDWMRDRSDQTAPGGTATHYIVRIRVRWDYLVLPFGAVGAGCVFVLAVVLETRHLGLPPWKADVLPILVHALDPETRARLRLAAAADAASPIATADGKKGNAGGDILRREAEATIVALERAKDGPQLKAASKGGRVPPYVPRGPVPVVDGGRGSGSGSSSRSTTPPTEKQE